MRSLACLMICIAAMSACSMPPAPPPRTTGPAQTPSMSTSATTPFQLPGRTFEPLDPFEQNRALGRGVNLGNALEAPVEGEWGMVLQEEFFPLIRQAGFATVRVPIRWSAHATREAPYTIKPDFFQRVDWVIENALKNDLNVVINMHHYEELFQDASGERDRFLTLWDQIATRYRDLPAQVVFEPLNEPHGMLTSGVWQRLFEDVLAVIRRTNPQRNVIFTGANWGGPDSLRGMKRPDDPHLIATFHYYLPFQFTHQGAEWVDGSNAWIGTTWKGTGNQRAQIDYDLDQVARWAKDNAIPLWMGEFGSYGKHADIESRERWTRYVARAAEARSISWAYWEFGAGFGVYDRARRQWNEPILNALIPR